MGNYLNAGSRNAQSIGFDISFLTKVSLIMKKHEFIFIHTFQDINHSSKQTLSYANTDHFIIYTLF